MQFLFGMCSIPVLTFSQKRGFVFVILNQIQEIEPVNTSSVPKGNYIIQKYSLNSIGFLF